MLETQKVIRLQSNGSALSTVAIPAECYKQGGTTITARLNKMFLRKWEQEAISQSFKDASIMHVYTCKGNIQALWTKQETRNHRHGLCCQVAPRKLHEQNTNLFSTYVDLTRAFAIVSREGQLKIMAKNGCPRICIVL
ncbi:uncharacterized protein LOC127847374 [Dreissena polymorpha]|uniref:uncharacterized protein LOC127847374 n=1 Tax=Dreissena polymorpha TaxID=45954 RepID=UPI002264C2ED|nr:uncharacterized protein LOC127847374 [Dreissena polymorpha]